MVYQTRYLKELDKTNSKLKAVSFHALALGNQQGNPDLNFSVVYDVYSRAYINGYLKQDDLERMFEQASIYLGYYYQRIYGSLGIH